MQRTPPDASSGRYVDLDGLRGFSMLLGLVYHALFSFTADTAGTFCHDSQSGRWADVAAAIPHGFRVEVFFLIGGFFARLVMTRSGVRGFAINRSRRVLRPLLIGGASLVLLMNVLMRYSLRLGLTAVQDNAPDWHPAPFYLWFLDYLMVLEVLTLSLVLLSRVGPLSRLTSLVMRAFDRGFRWVFLLPIAPLVLALPSSGLGLLMGDGPYFSYVPHFSWLAYEGVFFFCGWLLHRQPQLRLQLGARANLFLLGGALLFFARLWAGASLTGFADTYLAALYAWSVALGLLGFFAQRLAKPHAVTRYLADASYWTYLLHWPVLTFLQLSIAGLAIPGPIKVLGLIVVTGALCLLSYQYGVRYTALGVALHGRRHRTLPNSPAIDAPVAASVSVSR